MSQGYSTDSNNVQLVQFWDWTITCKTTAMPISLSFTLCLVLICSMYVGNGELDITYNIGSDNMT